MLTLSKDTLEEFKEVLEKLPEDCYSKCSSMLSNSTIGQHTRHVIELYQCLLVGYKVGIVSYDKRERKLKTETDLNSALGLIDNIIDSLERPNKNLIIEYKLDAVKRSINSNYLREVLYNLEHTIHHQALIKVAIQQFTSLVLPETFGVAPSTLQYRNQHVQ